VIYGEPAEISLIETLSAATPWRPRGKFGDRITIMNFGSYSAVAGSQPGHQTRYSSAR
jgi:hypothetical protein